jgi:hypothetical protein
MDRIKLGQYLVDKCYLLLQGVCTKLVSQLGWNTGQLFFHSSVLVSSKMSLA